MEDLLKNVKNIQDGIKSCDNHLKTIEWKIETYEQYIMESNETRIACLMEKITNVKKEFEKCKNDFASVEQLENDSVILLLDGLSKIRVV